jgi:hypothetical protein
VCRTRARETGEGVEDPRVTFHAIRSALLFVALALGAATLPPAAGAVAPGEALRLLNLQRAVNGIPPVAPAAGLGDGCAKHVAYIGLNGGVVASGEDPAKPGFTPEGDRQTLESSGVELLSGAPSWSEASSPWTLRPAHLFRMFDPDVAEAGYGDSAAVACLRLRGGRPAATAPELFSVPGPGRTGVPVSEINSESPYTPQQVAGIPAGQPTGPNILLFTRGLRGGLPLTSPAFSLVGPHGPVEVRLVAEATANPVGTGSWFYGGGVLIPVAPLAPFAPYVARVSWHRDAVGDLPAADAEHVIAFETGGLANPIAVDVVSRGHVNDIKVSTPAPNPTLKLVGPERLTAIARVVKGIARYAALAPGPWTACARSGGRAVGYEPASACRTFIAAGRVGLALATERGRTSVALRVPRVVDGRPAQVTVARYKLACREVDGRRRCTRKAVGRATRTSIMLKAPRMRVKLPSPQEGVRVSARIVLGAFKVGDAPYLATDIKRTWG